MESLLADTRYALRLLKRSPGFTVMAVLTLMLGMGATTSMFSVVHAVLLRPLPYRDADRIMTLWHNDTKMGDGKEDVSPANFLDWQEQNRVFERVALIEPYSYDFIGEGEPEVFMSSKVSEGFFEILGVSALKGRTFLPEEYRGESGSNVLVMSHGLWQRRFGSDAGILGKKLKFDEGVFTVVGVMPPEFRFPTKDRVLWSPRVLTEEDRKHRGGNYMKVVGRLKPGVTLDRAQADMDVIAAELERQYPVNEGVGVLVVPLEAQIVGEVRPALLVLLGAVGFVLLIGCVNVAHLFLARGAEREQEFAVRAALGAGRSRLTRQLLTESLVLAFLGGAGGLILSYWAIDVIKAVAPADLPRLEDVAVSPQVLLFAFGVSIVTAVGFGLAPIRELAKPAVQDSLKDGGRVATASARRRRARNFLMTAEVALALILLVGAGLLIRSFANLIAVQPGFLKDRVLALQVFIWTYYPKPEERASFFQEAFDRISTLPGVEAVGAVSALPFIESAIDIDTTFTVEGRPQPPRGQEPVTWVTTAAGDYYRAMGIPLLKGRLFNATDDAKAPPVVVISDAMARRHWPDEDPVGKKITLAYGRPTLREIVGVVGDVRHTGLDSDPRPETYIPHLQSPFGSMTLVVRTRSDEGTLLPAVKAQIWAMNPLQTIYRAASIEALVSASLSPRRFSLLLLGAFAGIALALAAIGIYGVVSFQTAQRTHEIGVRMALGAERSDILRLVVGKGILPALAGIAVGIPAALGLTRFLASFLFGVEAADPATYLLIALLLSLVAVLAAYFPARRATRVDPIGALRYQ